MKAEEETRKQYSDGPLSPTNYKPSPGMWASSTTGEMPGDYVEDSEINATGFSLKPRPCAEHGAGWARGLTALIRANASLCNADPPVRGCPPEGLKEPHVQLDG